MKCPLCENEYNGAHPDKQVHAHMLKAHRAEYAAKGNKLSAFGLKKEPPIKTDPPEDFRPLELTDQWERSAYNDGYRYFANDAAYTTAECKQKGWI